MPHIFWVAVSVIAIGLTSWGMIDYAKRRRTSKAESLDLSKWVLNIDAGNVTADTGIWTTTGYIYSAGAGTFRVGIDPTLPYSKKDG